MKWHHSTCCGMLPGYVRMSQVVLSMLLDGCMSVVNGKHPVYWWSCSTRLCFLSTFVWHTADLHRVRCNSEIKKNAKVFSHLHHSLCSPWQAPTVPSQTSHCMPACHSDWRSTKELRLTACHAGDAQTEESFSAMRSTVTEMTGRFSCKFQFDKCCPSVP